MGNIFILAAVIMDLRLHKPMYFFLGILAALDIVYTTTTIPKTLALLLNNDNTISFIACFTQMCILHIVGLFECLLLLVMAYDRYVAICSPLHYTSIMNNKFNIQIIVICFLSSSITIVSSSVFTAHFPYNGPNKINHRYCDHFFLSRLACTDITPLSILVMCILVIFVLTPFLLVILSYINIIKMILKINSAAGRWKTFSTCSSHIMVVFIYYLSLFINYSMYTVDTYSENIHVIGSIFSTILAPALNPLIYTLRNKDIQEAVKTFIKVIL
ncbi:olfactory receptor 2AT4-like [Protopterus annectens]|uniref:olfactory receptor 2AT4-like n=1 Tax=Protopterus annectens TaxID=7888 RepID=UPI001CF94FCF|nr:olfactory receptor 2AT4-like [Protopterus annectens]